MTETTVVPPEGLPSSPDCTCGSGCHFDCHDAGCRCPHHQAGANAALPTFEADMQRAIDHGNVSARMEALEAQLAAANEQIARLTGTLQAEKELREKTEADCTNAACLYATAEAENTRLRNALIASGRAAGALLADEVSNDFLMHVPAEIAAVIARLKTSALAAVEGKGGL